MKLIFLITLNIINLGLASTEYKSSNETKPQMINNINKQDVTINYEKANFIKLGKSNEEKKILEKIYNVSKKFNEDYKLVYGIAKTENYNFDNNLISKSGNIGIMQVGIGALKDVCKYYNLDINNYNLKDIDDNLEIGIRYIKFIKEKCNKNSTKEILLSYNNGPYNKNITNTKYPNRVFYHMRIFSYMNDV